MYYYANEFNYYKIYKGKKIFYHYVACKLYKSKKEAQNNALNQWLEIADEEEILENTYTKTMWL